MSGTYIAQWAGFVGEPHKMPTIEIHAIKTKPTCSRKTCQLSFTRPAGYSMSQSRKVLKTNSNTLRPSYNQSGVEGGGEGEGDVHHAQRMSLKQSQQSLRVLATETTS